MTQTKTHSVFYKLPNGFVRRNGFSCNTSHLIYREINTNQALKEFVCQRIKENLNDLFTVVKLQHIERHKDNDITAVQKMFPTEISDPKRYKQEQEQKQWEEEQKKRLEKWKKTHLAKKFLKNKYHFQEMDDDDTSSSDEEDDEKENLEE